jgi:malonate-semialdehyde dehydrogenase (acetylating) / methylmalonate-semialdehyde dehydrogenase
VAIEAPTRYRTQAFIDGRFVDAESGETFATENPANGEVIAQITSGGAAEIDAAVVAARRSFDDGRWSRLAPADRKAVLLRFADLVEANADELAALDALEAGKPITDARDVDLPETVKTFRWYAEAADKVFDAIAPTGPDALGLIVREPIGVVGAVVPWNFPILMAAWKMAPALASGNSMIVKPSRLSSLSAIRMAELAAEAGLPDGVLNVVHGDKAAVDAILGHPGIQAVSFVGSTPIAKYIYETCAKHGKRVQALGGAKNHAVVLPDADLEFTADALIGAAYGSAGERCMAISAVVAVGAAGDPLVKLLEKKASAIQLGVDMGPLVTAQHRDKVAGYVEAGVKEGAKLVLDGRKQALPREGFFLGTSLFDRVTPQMSIYRDEIFGPVLVVLRVDSLEKAIELVNNNPYANGTALFTESGGAARRFENEIQVGMVGINVPIPVPVAFFSFGGWKSSLFGDLHVHGVESVKFYTRTKVVTTRWPHQDTPAPGFNMPTLG